MKNLIARNLAYVGVIAFGLMSILTMQYSMYMIIGLLYGEWAYLHVLAMIGMCTGFMILTALSMAMVEYYKITSKNANE